MLRDLGGTMHKTNNKEITYEERIKKLRKIFDEMYSKINIEIADWIKRTDKYTK